MSCNFHTSRFSSPPKDVASKQNPMEIIETPTPPSSVSSSISYPRNRMPSKTFRRHAIQNWSFNVEEEEVIDLITPPCSSKRVALLPTASDVSVLPQWEHRTSQNDRSYYFSDDEEEEEEEEEDDDDDDEFFVSSLHQALDDLQYENKEKNKEEVIALDQHYDEEDEEEVEGREETEDDRKEREEKESLELARQLMAQEAMASYNASAVYLDENPDNLPEEDLEALRMFAQEAENEIYDEEDIIDDVIDDDDLSYDAMLRLGEQIGDVKEERWAIVAKSKIEALLVITHDENEVKGVDENDSKCKCLVCQFPYENGEQLRVLPCGHRFHSECVDQWLQKKDFCPYCRQCIVVSE